MRTVNQTKMNLEGYLISLEAHQRGRPSRWKYSCMMTSLLPLRGGVIRDEGNTLLAYSGPAGLCSITKAEVVALNIRLREALRLNPQLLVIEGDSSCAIKWASQPSSAPWYLADIVGEVVVNSNKVHISFHLIKRDANSEVDCLAKEGVSKPDLHIVTNP